MRRAVTWRPKATGTETVDIARLISPLRYDVAVRAQFFAFLQTRPDDEPTSELVAAALDEPYAVWFRHIAMARFRPWVLKDDDLFLEQFTERVVSAKALFEAIATHGFDSKHPITLRGTKGPQTADSGALVHRELHVGDGGHRLAILHTLGIELGPGTYVIDPRPMPVIDNTGVLVAHLGLEDSAYASFVARGYVDTPCDSLADLRAALAADPATLAEVEGVVAAQARTVASIRG